MRTRKIESKLIAVRVTLPFLKVIDEYLKFCAYVTPSDFFRDALREKIRKDAPQLIKSVIFNRVKGENDERRQD